ncbi:MAG: GGDEF domain-containing protein [Desulfuromonadaceae bacterium]|nr:GGDEF domain-containing protein [Desulfuromonadaceae bacterium]
MKKRQQTASALKKLNDNLRVLINQALNDDGVSLKEWLSRKTPNLDNVCCEKKNCAEKSCPAYMQKNCRCWLVAGTMCGGEIQGIFAKKYRSCTECEIYRDAVFADEITELEEHLIVLVHTLVCKQEEINSLAITDHLTGLYNRRYFDLLIPSEIESMLRNNGVIYITLIDIDDFKLINDKYGHLFGDKILKECAMILSGSTRKSDLLVRFGGDEFLIASSCSENDENSAKMMHQRILEKLEIWNVEHAYEGLELSLSLGCSVLKKGIGLETAINEADRRMYENKLINTRHTATHHRIK